MKMYFLALVVTVTFWYVTVPTWNEGKVSSAARRAELEINSKINPSQPGMAAILIVFVFIARFFLKLMSLSTE
jgi:hypothetical protein